MEVWGQWGVGFSQFCSTRECGFEMALTRVSFEYTFRSRPRGEGSLLSGAFGALIRKVVVRRVALFPTDSPPCRVSDLCADDLKQTGQAPCPDAFLFVTSEKCAQGLKQPCVVPLNWPSGGAQEEETPLCCV